MLYWDRELKRRINEATENIDWQLYMYVRYVDDANYVGSVMPPGARMENGKVVIQQELVENDLEISPDIRTAKMIKEIANEITPSIQVEIDSLSMHENSVNADIGLRSWSEGKRDNVPVLSETYGKQLGTHGKISHANANETCMPGPGSSKDIKKHQERNAKRPKM